MTPQTRIELLSYALDNICRIVAEVERLRKPDPIEAAEHWPVAVAAAAAGLRALDVVRLGAGGKSSSTGHFDAQKLLDDLVKKDAPPLDLDRIFDPDRMRDDL